MMGGYISDQSDKTVTVTRNPNGSAHIRREVFGELDLEWDSASRTPEEWVPLQDNSYQKSDSNHK